MKIIKKFFYGICILIIIGCAGMLFCALNPAVTESLAAVIQDREEEGSGTLIGIGNQEQPDNTLPAGGYNTDDALPDGLQVENTAYITPTNGVTTLPSQVSGKNGYVPVKETEQEIAENEVSALKDSLSTGETGSGLTFDTEIYPYYGMLAPDMQKLYNQIYANALKCTISFSPVVDVKVTQLKNVFEAVYNDHPELFWLQTGYSCKYVKNGDCLEISLQYYPITNKLEAAQTEFKAQAAGILSGAEQYSNNYEKEKYVHDALLSKTAYDKNADMNQSAYSAMVNGKSVCAGYARAYQYLLQQMGIPCYYCTGYSGENHAWNIVKLSDGYYNVDVTWDDTVPATYDYFNKSDNAMAGTHVRSGLSVYLPACGGGAYEDITKGAPQLPKLPEQAEPVEEQMKPLVWGEDNEKDKTDSDVLLKNGLTDADVLTTLEDYYKDCLSQMKAEGTGNRQFVNVVDEVMWVVIEREYTEGNYQTGYVEQALKDMGMEYFAIQLQVQSLGDGYYRLYHNILTWN
ncbi:MAG: hypothetical protein NC251_05975 [Lachnoclostridium sp.]|nr:hypothetical protein [Lachnospira sp.]MCM1247961.1 hypothetical protein [Lachnoclostridium sp.]MCM1535341.1 hypothetical protein [Clostridium sp.]